MSATRHWLGELLGAASVFAIPYGMLTVQAWMPVVIGWVS
jgi:hypothetical protein